MRIDRINRRGFLSGIGGVSAASLTGLGDLSFLQHLPHLSAGEVRGVSQIVRCEADVEPLVQLIEQTPRSDLLEVIARRIREGTSYQEILAALLLAGVRNVQPRPSVGFKFHAVLVVNSAHLASLSSTDSDRWLPIFWALDYFKSSQARDEQEGDWTMAAVDESKLPRPSDAPKLFSQAMQQWDEPLADVSIAQLARTSGTNRIFHALASFGIRDYRSIGHKAIFVANAWRTLQVIGKRHGEPVMRSLAYALLNHTGEPNPAQSDLPADRPWRENQPRADRIRGAWLDGRPSESARDQMLEVLRSGGPAEASEKVVELLNGGTSPRSVYDAIFLAAGELLMRQPGIVALHSMTTSNAMHYLFQTVGEDRTRRLILLQNAAFVTMFRSSMQGRGPVADTRIDGLQPADLPEDEAAAIEQLFDQVGRDNALAARMTLAYLRRGGTPQALIRAARRLVFLKGHDSHDYKFSSAVLEDYYHLSPQVRDFYLSSAVFHLKGTNDRDNQLVQRTRSALQV